MLDEEDTPYLIVLPVVWVSFLCIWNVDLDWILSVFEGVLGCVLNKNNSLCSELKYGIVYGMSFSVLHASISGISLPDYWKSSFVYCIGNGDCGLNATSPMEVYGLSVFEVNIH